MKIYPYYTEVLQVPARSVERLRTYCRDSHGWFHSFRFEHGIFTLGADASERKLRHLCLPPDLSGLSVLDIGTYDGFFAFHCKQRGAAHVVANDGFAWRLPGCQAWPHFSELRDALDLDLEVLNADVEALDEAVPEPFDIVLFLGVLYHAPDMVRYLRTVARLTRRLCVLETYVDLLEEDRPLAEFYPPGVLNNDPSNWWGPNLAAVEALALRCGFTSCELVNMWQVNTRNQIEGRPVMTGLRSGRVVLYLYK